MSPHFCLRQYLSPWLVLGGVTLIQSFSGTFFVYSTCSTIMQQNFDISPVQFNNLIVASEIGKIFGLISNDVVDLVPEPLILVIGLGLGLLGYGVQYLSIVYHQPIGYWQLVLLNVLAGNSISWINSYCELVIRKCFKNNCDIISAIASCYCGLSGKIYTNLFDLIQRWMNANSTKSSMYLMLVSIGPVLIGLPIALSHYWLDMISDYEETKILPFAFISVISTCLYGLIESIPGPMRNISPIFRVVNLILFMILPLFIACVLTAMKNTNIVKEGVEIIIIEIDQNDKNNDKKGDETWPKNVDFWLFYLVNMFGATLGMVYLNNLSKICELHKYQNFKYLLATSSAYGFVGRIFPVIFTWYKRKLNIYISEPTTVIMFMMVPLPFAFLMLMSTKNISLYFATGIIGTVTGALSAIIGSTSTMEAMKIANSDLVQMILQTNVPIGTLLFGYMAAHDYQSDCQNWGLKCHQVTFIIWGFASLVGTLLSVLMYVRSKMSKK